jgi:hypothetical protein
MDDIVNLLKKLKNSTLNSIKVCMPAKIETYDFKTQKASVKIDMKELYEDGSNIDYPVVSGVPVVFMASGGASITMPVNKGDTCLLIFTDRDMSNWLLGGTGQSPNSTRMHNLSDAIAIMGLFPFTKTSKAENNTDVLITYSGSKIILKPDGVLNIETTKDVNIITANDVNIAATNNIFSTSKNTTIVTSEDTIIKCRNAAIIADEDVNINSKNANITTTENMNIIATGNMKVNCTNAEINAEEEVSIQCTSLRAVVAQDAVIECNEATILANNNISLNSKNNNITTSEDITVNCANAIVNASNEIKTTSIKFIHTGDMSISGNLELGGSGSGIANSPISFSAGIKNTGDITNMGNVVNTGGTIRSGTVVLDTHTHSYLQPVVGSTPTAATPAFTGTPT